MVPKLFLQLNFQQPSQVGIQSSIGFDTYYNDVLIGSVAGPVTLSPNAVSPLPLAGRLVPQTTPAGIAAVAEVFNNFLTGKDSNVVVLGASAGSGDVSYFAFKFATPSDAFL